MLYIYFFDILKPFFIKINTDQGQILEFFFVAYLISKLPWGHRGCDHMVVGFTTTCAISAYHHESCEFESRSW